MSKQGYVEGRRLLLEFLPVIEWGGENEKFYGIAQDVFLGYNPEGNYGWIRVTTDSHPTLTFEFLGASFDEALAMAKTIAEQAE